MSQTASGLVSPGHVSQQDSLLVTKLYVPRASPSLVPRPRLIQRLDEGLRLGHRLTFIAAPAGFGKTTLVIEWLQHLDSAPTDGLVWSLAWLSLDADDNDPTRFLTYLIAALETAQPGVGADARATLQSPRPPPLKSVMTLLINSLAAGSAERAMQKATPHLASKEGEAQPGLLLVLDDYHVIEQQAIHEGLSFLLDHLPPDMHLVIASRVDPPLHLARLRTRAQLTELREEELRFLQDEALAFLNQTMGLDLSPQDVAALEARTEGWVAGLQLAALSMQGRSDERVADFVAAFSGSHRHVIDYLAEEVLAQQPEAVHDFLCQTSILDRLTGPLCEAVTGREDSDLVLRELEGANLFLIPLDDERQWYRYHHLFADFLRAHLEKDLSDQVVELHRQAGTWYERQGLVAPAIDHALSARDTDRAADLIEAAADATLMRSQVATFLNWADALPDETLRARPILVVYQAWMLLLGGQPLDVVEARVQEVMEADNTGSISGEVTVFQALIAAYQGDTRRSAELADRALELLPEERLFLRSVVAGLLGLNYLYAGDLATARRALEQSVRVSRQAGNLMMAVISTCHLAELSMIEGRLHKARGIYEQALVLAVDDHGRPLPVAGIAFIGLGNLLREWNDLEAARRHLSEGIELTERWGEVGAINGYVGLARIKQVQGNTEGARQAIETAQQLAIRFDAMEMDDILVGAHQVRLWLEQGELGPALRWVEERGLSGDAGLAQLEGEVGSASLTFYQTLEYIILAQATLAQGRPAQALEVLETLHPAAEAGGWTWYVIGILILKSLAFQAQGFSAQAMTCLRSALSLAEPGGYVRIFVDEGPRMAALLRAAVARNIAPQYASRLLAAFDDSSATTPAVPQTQPLIEPLSERELEVLRLVAAGLSNREIAQELVIAVSTTKTHINHIYRKLDVSSRTQAVARARELNLIT